MRVRLVEFGLIEVDDQELRADGSPLSRRWWRRRRAHFHTST